MTLIRPDTIQFTASVSEAEIRDRMALEVLESIGALAVTGSRWRGSAPRSGAAQAAPAAIRSR